MKLLTRALIEESKSHHKQSCDSESSEVWDRLQKKLNGTPRFATGEEIENEEKRLLLTFAFKNQDEVDNFKRELSFVINME